MLYITGIWWNLRIHLGLNSFFLSIVWSVWVSLFIYFLVNDFSNLDFKICCYKIVHSVSPQKFSVSSVMQFLFSCCDYLNLFLINLWNNCLFNGSFVKNQCTFFFCSYHFLLTFLNFCFYQFFFLLFPSWINLSLASLFFCCFLMNGIKVVNFPIPPPTPTTLWLYSSGFNLLCFHCPFQMVCHFSFDFPFYPNNY